MMSKEKKMNFSVEVLADILSQSKSTMEARIRRGELKRCEESGTIGLDQVEHHPEIQSMVQTLWMMSLP
ncbi:hypothetical protein JCM19240_3285 [Vibrio maritimus]|uniref:Uncharacterized protein n=1 Tax=Vibrio maritimus TaxID=990268 RepID=A0A090U5W2_9VIBR|nr:hypothetical protein JCM19240_3285 [Vibrio maritimus]